MPTDQSTIGPDAEMDKTTNDPMFDESSTEQHNPSENSGNISKINTKEI